MKIFIEGWDAEARQAVRGELEGPDRAQTQAADLLTVELSDGQRVTVKQNPQALRGSNVRVGAACWDGALVAAAYFDAQPAGTFSGLKVVELGAGVGLAGLVLAKLGAVVTLTDRPQALSFARMSAAKNGMLAGSVNAAANVVQTQPLEWGTPSVGAAASALAAGGVDLVLATDCIYPSEHLEGAAPSSSGFVEACAMLCSASSKGSNDGAAAAGEARVFVTFEKRSEELRTQLLDAARERFDFVAPVALDGLPPAFQLPHIEFYEFRQVKSLPL